MKLIITFLLAFSLILSGCNKGGSYSNPYYERMKKLADQVESEPGNPKPLHELEQYTKSWEEWNRIYAYGYIDILAVKNASGCRIELIPYLDKALMESDQSIRRDAASTLCDINSDAVEKTLPELVKIIQKFQEDDDVWFSIMAVGNLTNKKMAEEVLPILLKAANYAPPKGTSDEAPQVRYFALDSIKNLAAKNKLNVIPDLEKLLKENTPPYKSRIASAIIELDPENKAAQEIINANK